jgi:nitrogen fixation-related uncharacterized protein
MTITVFLIEVAIVAFFIWLCMFRRNLDDL